MNEEMEFHLALETEDRIRAGMSRVEAERAARRDFGGLDRFKEEARQAAGIRPLDLARQDFSTAVRSLRARPGHTALVAACLGLGIGANAAVFTIFDAVLLDPISLPDARTLRVIRERLPAVGMDSATTAIATITELRRRRDLFEEVGGVTRGTVTMRLGHSVRRIEGALTAGGFFEALRATAYLGRLDHPELDPSGTATVILGYSLWRELGSDSAMIGRTLELEGVRHEVIGVLPPGLRYPVGADVWAVHPAAADELDARVNLDFVTIARVRPEVTQHQLDRGLDEEVDAWRREFPKIFDSPGRVGYGVIAVPAAPFFAGAFRPILVLLAEAAAAVLLVVCATVAGVQLLRASRREREFALRAAVGAAPGRIVRQLVAEQAMLAIGGAVLGLAVGAALLPLISRADAAQPIAGVALSLDLRVVGFTSAVAALATVLAGLIPVLRASRLDVAATLADSTRGDRGHRWALHWIVAGQVAVTFVLLIGSGLAVRLWRNRVVAERGFAEHQVVTMRVTAPVRTFTDRSERARFWRDLQRKLSAAGTIASVGWTNALPAARTAWESTFDVVSPDGHLVAESRPASIRPATAGYFQTLEIPLLRGRWFAAGDTIGSAEVALVDSTLARAELGGIDVLGRRIVQADHSLRVIGVVGSVPHARLGAAAKPTIYVPWSQWPQRSASLVARSTMPVETVAGSVRAAAASLDASAVVADAEPLARLLHRSVAVERLVAQALGSFAAVALLLSLLGVHATVSYFVESRARDLGLRLLLGAGRGSVAAIVFRTALLVAGFGVAIGAGAAMAFDAALPRWLGIDLADPVVAAGAVVVVAMVAALAAYLPARRAALLDPLDVLRAD